MLAFSPSSPATSLGGAEIVGMYGSSRRNRGSRPSSRCVIVVLPATAISWIS